MKDWLTGVKRTISWHRIAVDCIYNQYNVNQPESKEAVASCADIPALKDGVLRAFWINSAVFRR